VLFRFSRPVIARDLTEIEGNATNVTPPSELPVQTAMRRNSGASQSAFERRVVSTTP
jgi:hypothetical protein